MTELNKVYKMVKSAIETNMSMIFTNEQYLKALKPKIVKYHLLALQASLNMFLEIDHKAIFLFWNRILEEFRDIDTLKSVLFIIRKVATNNHSTLWSTLEIYAKYYTDKCIDFSKNYDQKYSWYVLKEILVQILLNIDKINKKSFVSKTQVCYDLANLITPGDEYAFMVLISEVFKDNSTLYTFFLGYCNNVKATEDISRPLLNWEEPCLSFKFNRQIENVYLPLSNEWFINPLLHVAKANSDSSEIELK